MKTPVLILSLIVCAGLNAQKGSLNLSKWHVNDEIKASDYQSIKKAKLYFFISNDYDNIYIDLKVEDPGIQNRILKEGLTIWINMDGKSAKKMGIRFPIGSKNQAGRIPNSNFSTPLSLANTIELIGFTNEEVRHFPSENSDNFRGKVKYDNEGTLYYKMLMPIAKLPIRNSKKGDGAMPFTLGIEYGFLPSTGKPGNRVSPTAPLESQPGGSRGGASGGGRSRGGGRTGRGGDVPASAAGTTSTPYQPVITPILQWIKDIKLATSK